MKFRKIRRSFKVIFRSIKAPFRWANRSVNFLLSAIYQYWSSRRFKYFLYGFPAMLVMLLSTYVAASCLLQPSGLVMGQYTTAGRRALSSNQYKAARLYLQRAVELGSGDSETLFDLAIAAEKMKDFVRVQAIMQILAPDSHPVHAPSHLWMATRLLTKKDRTANELKRAITHLEYTLELRHNDTNAHTLLGELYLQMRLFRDAVPHLAAVAPERPHLSLSLAKAYKYSGEYSKAVSAGEAAETYYTRKSIEFPFNRKARLKRADSLMFLERYQEAAQVLNDGITLEDDEQFRFGLARVYIAWSDSFELTSPAQRQRKLKLLTAGLNANPNEMLLFDRLMPILALKNETAQQAEQFLLDSITNGRSPGLCHLLLGSNAYLKKNKEQAAFHLEQAIRQMPSAPIVANNLAWYLTMSDPPDLDRALTLVEPIIAQFPGEYEYRETRGQILLRQKKWKQSISDLEYALPHCRNKAVTHDALSIAYGELGSKQLAKKHRDLSNQLINTIE